MTQERYQTLNNKLQELASLQPNWDTYGALPIDQLAIDYAATMLQLLQQQNILPPSIVPMCDGGLQLEWHVRGWDVEWEIHQDGVNGDAFWQCGTAQEQVFLPQEQEQLMQLLLQHLAS